MDSTSVTHFTHANHHVHGPGCGHVAVRQTSRLRGGGHRVDSPHGRERVGREFGTLHDETEDHGIILRYSPDGLASFQSRQPLILIFHAFNVLSVISFMGFGGYCLVSEAMRREFQRYGLSRYRKMTGLLQMGGAAGLMIGWVVPWVGMAAATGLSLQMLAGLGVRISIRDPWYKCLPAAFYCVLNALLAWMYGANLNFS